MISNRFKPITADDYLSWSTLWRRYLEFYNTTLPESQYLDTFSRLTSPSGDLHGILLLHPETEQPIGLAHFLYHSNAWTSLPHCYLNDLYVDPESRGSGYGKALIMAVKAESQKKGCQRLYWSTAPDNEAARRLYDKVATTNRVLYKMDL
jgi:ribosomal protein S18 acetylase RimI-like enzyme